MIDSMSLVRQNFLSASVALSLGSAGVCCLASDQQPTAKWREECVGRMALMLPGDSETATDSVRSLGKRGLWTASSSAARTFFSFSDGVDGWTTLGRGPIDSVSPRLLPDQIALMRSFAEKGRLKLIEEMKGQLSPVGKPYDFSFIPTPDKRMRAEHSVFYFRYEIQLGTRVVEGTFPFETDEPEDNQRLVAKVFNSVKAREIFEIPTEPGLCYPYIFFSDDSDRPRDIGMDFRSKSRPDVHITFSDATAADLDKESIDSSDEAIRNTWRNNEPDRRIQSFWEQRRYDGVMTSEWLPHTRTVEMAGRRGLQSFVRLSRTNGTVDYEYYAYVRGDPKAAVDTPDLALYLYTSNDYGKNKGLTPISKDDFLKMAQHVAASVRHRQVK